MSGRFNRLASDSQRQEFNVRNCSTERYIACTLRYERCTVEKPQSLRCAAADSMVKNVLDGECESP